MKVRVSWHRHTNQKGESYLYCLSQGCVYAIDDCLPERGGGSESLPASVHHGHPENDQIPPFSATHL